MKSLHLEKKGLRGLGIAESFSQNSKKSILTGVVMRRDFVIDGFVFGNATLSGDDATDEILKMYKKLDRPDISYIMISGIIISLYNMIDIKKIHDELGIPIIGVTYNDSKGLADAIKFHFPNSYEEKLAFYNDLGGREKISLKTGHDVYVRKEGCTLLQTKQILDSMTKQGSIPESLRVAQMLAKSLLRLVSS
jgi:uncharacterized protein